MEDEIHFSSCVADMLHCNEMSLSYLSDKLFLPFELNDKDHSILGDTDSDLNFYNVMNQYVAQCNYYLEPYFNEHIINKVPTTKSLFSHCHVNIRSIKKNLSEFETYLQLLDHEFTVIGLTETWLNDSSCEICGINGYKSVEKHRSGMGGAVALFIRDNLTFTERNYLAHFDEDIESVYIEIGKDQQHSNRDIVIGVIYRPPNRDIVSFNDKLCITLDRIKRENKLCYLFGDFNINLLNHDSHIHTGEFIDLLSTYSFLPLITRPTRVTASTATLIDNILTNNVDNIVHSDQGILVTDVTDYYPVFHIHRIPTVQEVEVYMLKRIYSVKNKHAFIQSIAETDWSEIYNVTSTEIAFMAFHKKLIDLLTKYFPKVKVKKKYHYRKPWLSEALRTSIKHKNKLYHRYTKINSVKSEILYKSYKTKLTQILKQQKKSIIKICLEIYTDNMNKSWGIIKRLINRNQVQSYQTKFRLADVQIINDKFAIAKHFNHFFTNIDPNLAKGIPKVDIDPLSYMGEALKETLFLSPVTETEINKIIKDLKDSATGHDDISAQFLKLSVDFIVNPLMHICNMSLTEGVFPDSLKVANVIPLYKSDDPMYFNHYRPVSLLCMLSKVFEKIMYDRLLNFVNKNDLLYAHQYGFRKNRSIYMALLSLVDNLSHALQNGEYVVGVYLDFSKAFDTVDHMILLQTLYHCGVRGCAHDCFTSYLSNRSQFVTYNGVKSDLKNIQCGVPQGSVLGPLLFLLYINDLALPVKEHFQFYLLMIQIYL